MPSRKIVILDPNKTHRDAVISQLAASDIFVHSDSAVFQSADKIVAQYGRVSLYVIDGDDPAFLNMANQLRDSGWKVLVWGVPEQGPAGH